MERAQLQDQQEIHLQQLSSLLVGNSYKRLLAYAGRLMISMGISTYQEHFQTPADLVSEATEVLICLIRRSDSKITDVTMALFRTVLFNVAKSVRLKSGRVTNEPGRSYSTGDIGRLDNNRVLGVHQNNITPEIVVIGDQLCAAVDEFLHENPADSGALPRRKKMLRMHMLGHSGTEIAKDFGIVPSTVSQGLGAIRKVLSRHLEAAEYL